LASGGLGAPLAAIEISVGVGGGAAIGKGLGHTVANFLFSNAGDKARRKSGSEHRDEIEKAQETERKRGNPDKIRSIEKSKQRGKVDDWNEAQKGLDGGAEEP
jgi:hypothetical protein